MAFLRVKHIKGGDYLYLVENHRDYHGKVYQNIVRYLGRIGGTSKAQGPYNTIHRQYHHEQVPSPEEVALALQNYPLRSANTHSLTPRATHISTTKPPISDGSVTFNKNTQRR